MKNNVILGAKLIITLQIIIQSHVHKQVYSTTQRFLVREDNGAASLPFFFPNKPPNRPFFFFLSLSIDDAVLRSFDNIVRGASMPGSSSSEIIFVGGYIDSV